MSLSKFWKEAVAYRLAGGHAADHSALGITKPSRQSILDALAPKPIGFNYYSLVYEILLNFTASITNRPALLAYIASTGANMVRFSLPAVFSNGQYLSLVHNTGSMPSTMQTSNLRSTYIAAVDTAMNALASNGLKAHVNDLFWMDSIGTAIGETRAIAYGSTTSMTAVYAQSAAAWFFSRYKNHPAFGIYSIGNEYVTDSTGTTGPTEIQLGAWLTAVANAARAVDSTKIITADLLFTPVSNAQNRITLDNYATTIRNIASGLDAYSIHIYGSGFGYVGRSANEDATYPNTNATDLGYEGLPSLMEALRAIADADGKPLIIGEFGVPTTEESDAVSDKKSRTIRAMAQFANYALLWNAQESTIAIAAGNQSTWYINQGTARANTFLPLVTQANSGRVPRPRLGGGITSLRNNLAPRYAFKGTRVSSANILFTSTTGMASSTGYSLLFWMRIDAALNVGEILIGLNGDNTNGVALVGAAPANSTNNTQGYYFETRGVGNVSRGNTTGIMPDPVIGEWNHYAFTSEGVNGGGAITMYLNGLYQKTLPVIGAPASIVSGVNMFICGGNTNFGVPVSFQDICLGTSISPQDVWDHMQGKILPQSLLHVRATANKKAIDLSKNAIPISLNGAGITVVQV